MNKKKTGSFLKIVLIVLSLFVFCVGGLVVWNYVFKSNTDLQGKNFIYLKIPKSTDYEGLKKIISESGVIKDMGSFDFYARQIGLEKKIHYGRFRVNAGMSNRQIVKMIAQGMDEKVEISINYTTRTRKHLSEKLSGKLNISQQDLNEFYDNEQVLDRSYGLNKNNLMVIVRPGKYLFSWSSDQKDFFDFMKKEYDKFWTTDKLKKLKRTKLSREEVMIMASIIDWESNISSEQRKIAGVYLNRLNRNMLLQADPTVIFALDNFSKRRVSFQDLKIDSPFNTYKYKGLPPGPIGFPSDKSINSVLNFEESNYLFFCAKPELNGYSNFSKTIEEHETYAKAYRSSLNRRGIHR